MQTKILLDEEQIPKRWYNVQADMPSPLDPPLHPQTHKPIGPADLSAIFPAELIRQEVTTDRYCGYSRRSAGCAPALETKPPVSRPPIGKIPQDPGKDLLQVGGCEPGRKPQGQFVRPAGVLQYEGRDRTALNGDRGRASGVRPLLCHDALRSRLYHLHGAVELHAEAVPEVYDEGLGCGMYPEPQYEDSIRACGSRKGPGNPGKPRHCHI